MSWSFWMWQSAAFMMHRLLYSKIDLIIDLYSLPIVFGLCCVERAEIDLSRFRRLYDLAMIFAVCGSQVSLLSNLTPKKSASFVRGIFSPKRLTEKLLFASASCLGHLVNRMSFDLIGLRVTNHFLHHSSTFSTSLCMILLASEAFVFVVHRPTSSANWEESMLLLSKTHVRSLTKMR